jgi:hypothetical protein
MKILKHGLIALTLALLVPTPAARAATNTVTSVADGGAGSLRLVVTNAVAGDTIIFTNTLSGQTILLTNGSITLNKSVTIDASMLAKGISIDGNQAVSVFRSTAGTNTLTGLTITNGYAAIFGGGGIYNVGANLTLNRCTLVGNSTPGSGGGLLGEATGSVTVNQCALTGNSAGSLGGAIYNYWNMTVNQSTVTGNSAGTAGGGIRNNVTNRLYNSIVAGNFAPAQIEISDSGTFISTGVNLTNGAPLLAPLGNYGGPTLTMPPLPGSPAINGCTSGTTYTNDQRGALRVFGPFADLGAVEGVFDPSFRLANPARLGNGSFQFSFTNLTGASFTVFTSTNVVLPLSQWSNRGPAAEILPNTGQYKFTDAQATNASRRFYSVRSP